MKKKNGFISMSLVYTFFMLFITIMLSLVATYAHNRILLNKVSDSGKETLENTNHYKLRMDVLCVDSAFNILNGVNCGYVFPVEYDIYPGSIKYYNIYPNDGYTINPNVSVGEVPELVNCYSDQNHDPSSEISFLINAPTKQINPVTLLEEIVNVPTLFKIPIVFGRDIYRSSAISDKVYIGTTLTGSYNRKRLTKTLEELASESGKTKEEVRNEILLSNNFVFEKDVYCTIKYIKT